MAMLKKTMDSFFNNLLGQKIEINNRCQYCDESAELHETKGRRASKYAEMPNRFGVLLSLTFGATHQLIFSTIFEEELAQGAKITSCRECKYVSMHRLVDAIS